MTQPAGEFPARSPRACRSPRSQCRKKPATPPGPSAPATPRRQGTARRRARERTPVAPGDEPDAESIARSGLRRRQSERQPEAGGGWRSVRQAAYAAASRAPAMSLIRPRRRNAYVLPRRPRRGNGAARGARPRREGHGPARIVIHTASARSTARPATRHGTRCRGPEPEGRASSAVVGGVMNGRSMTVPAGRSVR